MLKFFLYRLDLILLLGINILNKKEDWKYWEGRVKGKKEMNTELQLESC